MIQALMRLAGKAGGMRSAAAMVAARGLVAEAAKLNERREPPGETTPPEPPKSSIHSGKDTGSKSAIERRVTERLADPKIAP